ncbi:U32 family peptidase [Listeria marthii]|uniref:U32 family peptidase n=1 Tax=Listeria marthii TaxID=529731 RepID=UPI00162A54B2|nr:U32 family peptidase [Listeria marthii]MBC1970818.1 peptidase U32 [Listeria marthii]MBC2063152.1 peptidase U32 [Listeria marthii]MBC2077476.1 peptidase U32 [Listeria marthii]MBC2086377.1 peptidase U32 [Listeria marthii]MBF2490581.1 U32 family peptidase [Listeria marthii]
MKISVATNFDENLIKGIEGTDVTNLFGKLTNDFVGGGLETTNLNSINRNKVENHVKQAHDNGLTFNYTFNNPFLSNEEFTQRGKNELKELLDWLYEIEVDSLTVSIPIILQYVKKNYPKLEVKISSSVCVNSVSKIRYWEEMGADCIVLDPMTVNRDFILLKDLRNSTNIDLELIVNNNCLYECPMLPYHQAFLGQSSRMAGKKVDEDYCYLGCSKKRVLDPVNYLISDIIRPEDIHYYEKLGYSNIKIIDRATPTELLVKRCKVYTDRKYEGNLLDLIQHFGYQDASNPYKYLDNIFIDNSKLNKHLTKFLAGECNKLECGEKCKHCYSFAKRAIFIDEEFRKKHLEKIDYQVKKIEKL